MEDQPAPKESRLPDEFMVSVWDPDAFGHPRGWATARLFVYMNELQVVATRLGRRLGGAPESLRYSWPAVVIAPHTLIPQVDILVEINAKLGRVAVRSSHDRLRRALLAADFEVVEVQHPGWGGAPRPLSQEELGAALGRVPACVVAR